ncbi:MAG TPA: hypothetical protein VF203_07985 [Burkholderiales bacterium]
MQEPRDSEDGGGPGGLYERRRGERRSGTDRRGVLRWDPRAAERERRSGRDRRRAPGDQTRQ